MLKAVIFIIGILGLFYLIVCLYMYFSQEKILFLIQNPDKKYYSALKKRTNINVLEYSPEPGITLRGWKQNDPTKPLIILYFGGNAEDITYFLGDTSYSGANVISFNYRGYGESEGKPSEKSLFSDALQIYDFLVQIEKIRPENIIIMGRSLGSGVATYLASERQAGQVILISPYDSMVRIAQVQYPFLPVSLLLKHRFESTIYARKKNNPLLSIYGGKDIVIPNSHTEKLLEKWNGTVKRVFVPDATHSDIMSSPITLESIQSFILSK